ncbi:hypothetical protein TNCV_3659401 [Trichonephila clavipes]|nr:hypothetical protein TNCV_3659401 [Trichonephila clavipes]
MLLRLSREQKEALTEDETLDPGPVGLCRVAETSRNIVSLNVTLVERSTTFSKRFQRVPNSPTWSPMTPRWSPKSPNWPPTWSPKMMPTWLYRQDFAKLSLKRHYNWFNSPGLGLALDFSSSLFDASLLPASVLQFLVLKTWRSFPRPSIDLRINLVQIRVLIITMQNNHAENQASDLYEVVNINSDELNLSICPEFVAVAAKWSGREPVAGIVSVE